MSTAIVELSDDEFAARYPLHVNHISPDAAYDGCMFETYGAELAFVQSQPAEYVWTIVDDDEGNLVVVNGPHFVNRLGYLVSTVPAPLDATIIVADN